MIYVFNSSGYTFRLVTHVFLMQQFAMERQNASTDEMRRQDVNALNLFSPVEMEPVFLGHNDVMTNMGIVQMIPMRMDVV